MFCTPLTPENLIESTTISQTKTLGLRLSLQSYAPDSTAITSTAYVHHAYSSDLVRVDQHENTSICRYSRPTHIFSCRRDGAAAAAAAHTPISAASPPSLSPASARPRRVRTAHWDRLPRTQCRHPHHQTWLRARQMQRVRPRRPQMTAGRARWRRWVERQTGARAARRR